MVVIAASTGGPGEAISRIVSAALPGGLPAARCDSCASHARCVYSAISKLNWQWRSPRVAGEGRESERHAAAWSDLSLPGIASPSHLGNGKIRARSGFSCRGPQNIVRARTWRWRKLPRDVWTFPRAGRDLDGNGERRSGWGEVSESGGRLHYRAEMKTPPPIFGMPAEAIKAGVADKVLPLDEISAAIERHVSRLSHLALAESR